MKPHVVALLVVVAILAGFYGGYRVGHTAITASTSTPKQLVRPGASAGPTRGFGAAPCPSPGATPSASTQALARGTISNLTSSSLTVTNPNCDVKVTLGANITVSKTVAGSTADLKNDLTVTIIGTREPDGSILAQTIQIGSSTLAAGPPGG